MKNFLTLILILTGLCLPAFAEKIPVKITPAQLITTNNDEIEVGDYIKFITMGDVYKDNKLYIKPATPVYGIVDFVHKNGWTGDFAEIDFKKFITQDISGGKIIINYPISIKGENKTNNNFKTFLLDVSLVVRGAEVNVAPYSTHVNIFLEN